MTPKVRGFLPKHYSKILRDRIKEKTGQEFSRSYINMVIHGKRLNNLILEEAALLAAEEKKRQSITACILDSL